ncbi:hypothetical protein Esti_001110 [Eimeria stiedai]
MARKRKGYMGRASEAPEASKSPVLERRASPDYSPMPALSSGGFSPLPASGFDGGPSAACEKKKHKKHKGRRGRQRRSRSRSPSSSCSSSSSGEGRTRKSKKSHKSRKSRKSKHKHNRAASPRASLAAAAAGGGEEEEQIVIFDRASHAFTAEVRKSKESPLGPPPSTTQGPLGLHPDNYRRAFGLSCGGYSFVSEGPPLPAAAAAAASAAAAQAAAGGGPAVAAGALLSSSVMAGGLGSREKGEAQGEGPRINPRTHPHLYWSCWNGNRFLTNLPLSTIDFCLFGKSSKESKYAFQKAQRKPLGGDDAERRQVEPATRENAYERPCCKAFRY